MQPVLDKHCGKCHQGDGKGRAKLDLTLRPGVSVFKEPYLTLVGPAGWGNPARGGRPGYGAACALPVESIDPSTNDPRAYATFRPMTYLSYRYRLIENAMSGKHNDVKVDAEGLHRLIAWVDACCPYNGDEEIRAMPDPDFAGIDELPIRPLVGTAPSAARVTLFGHWGAVFWTFGPPPSVPEICPLAAAGPFAGPKSHHPVGSLLPPRAGGDSPQRRRARREEGRPARTSRQSAARPTSPKGPFCAPTPNPQHPAPNTALPRLRSRAAEAPPAKQPKSRERELPKIDCLPRREAAG